MLHIGRMLPKHAHAARLAGALEPGRARDMLESMLDPAAGSGGHLDLSRTSLRHSDPNLFQAILAVLQATDVCHKLSLADCSLSAAAFSEICSVLAKNRSVQSVTLAHNHIGDVPERLRSVTELISNNSVIEGARVSQYTQPLLHLRYTALQSSTCDSIAP